MAVCRLIDECAFYSGSLRGVPGPSTYLKEHYCHNSMENCDRLRRHAMEPVSDPRNNVTPLGADLGIRLHRGMSFKPRPNL